MSLFECRKLNRRTTRLCGSRERFCENIFNTIVHETILYRLRKKKLRLTWRYTNGRSRKVRNSKWWTPKIFSETLFCNDVATTLKSVFGHFDFTKQQPVEQLFRYGVDCIRPQYGFDFSRFLYGPNDSFKESWIRKRSHTHRRSSGRVWLDWLGPRAQNPKLLHNKNV